MLLDNQERPCGDASRDSTSCASPAPQLKREWSLLAIFGRANRSLSPYLKYMAHARIPEFESDMPSQAVRSLWTMSGANPATSAYGEGVLTTTTERYSLSPLWLWCFSGYFSDALTLAKGSSVYQ
jgi:hypothetical protein